MIRVLVHEWASGGGALGRLVPAGLAREGRAMRDALAEDLQRIPGVEVVMTVDPRFPPRLRLRDVRIARGFDAALRSVDAAWLIAPETEGRLSSLADRVTEAGVRLLGSSAAAIAQVSDKSRLPARFARLAIPHPETRRAHGTDASVVASRLGYPLVVKPARGAGSQGVRRVTRPSGLGAAIDSAARHDAVLLQRFVAGDPASVSLICDGRRSRVLAVNSQELSPTFIYRGGETPWTAPLAARAARLARKACDAHAGLRGYVGVDVVLAGDEVFVLEINPRLTTAYLGLRASLPANVAALVLAACDGRMPRVPRARRRVRFTASGRVSVA